MNIVSRTLLLTLLVVVLGACEDPWDRVQGEPGEEGLTAVTEAGESGPAEVTAEPREVTGEPNNEGAGGETHEEGAAEEGH